MAQGSNPQEATIEVLRYGINTNREWLQELNIIEIGNDELQLGLRTDTVHVAVWRLVGNGIARRGNFVIPNGWQLSPDERKEREFEPGFAIGPTNDDFLEPYRNAPKIRTSMGRQSPHIFQLRYRLSQYGEMMPVAELQIVEQGGIIPGLAMPVTVEQDVNA